MNFPEYQAEARRTRAGEPSLVIAALGLAGESGEFADHIKKHLAQGHVLDEEKLMLELGDVLWYVALAADALGVGMSEVASRNVDKLRARYPGGFVAEQSRNRPGQ